MGWDALRNHWQRTVRQRIAGFTCLVLPPYGSPTLCFHVARRMTVCPLPTNVDLGWWWCTQPANTHRTPFAGPRTPSALVRRPRKSTYCRLLLAPHSAIRPILSSALCYVTRLTIERLIQCGTSDTRRTDQLTPWMCAGRESRSWAVV